jgi:hypothetical protein
MPKQPFTAFGLCNTVTKPICWLSRQHCLFGMAQRAAWFSLVPGFTLISTLGKRGRMVARIPAQASCPRLGGAT